MNLLFYFIFIFLQVIARIFFVVNRSWSGFITLSELRRSNLLTTLRLLQEEDDVKQITDFFVSRLILHFLPEWIEEKCLCVTYVSYCIAPSVFLTTSKAQVVSFDVECRINAKWEATLFIWILTMGYFNSKYQSDMIFPKVNCYCHCGIDCF